MCKFICVFFVFFVKIRLFLAIFEAVTHDLAVQFLRIGGLADVKCLEFNKENFELLITGNPQTALVLLKLFCKRIYDQKRRFRILCIKDLQARLADVFLMLDEMNPVSNPTEKARRFNVTLSDIAHWAGLTQEVTHDEINKLVEKRKIEMYDSYVIVSNIVDMRRMYETRSGNVNR